MTALSSQITIDETIHHGAPVIAGTRVPVALVLGSLAGGMSKEEISREYELSNQQIDSALAFAADVVAQVEVVSLAGV